MLARGDIALAIAEQQIEKRPQRLPDQSHIGLPPALKGGRQIEVATRLEVQAGIFQRPIGGLVFSQSEHVLVEHPDPEIEQVEDPLGNIGKGLNPFMLARRDPHPVERLRHQFQAGAISDRFKRLDKARLDRRHDHQIGDPVEML